MFSYYKYKQKRKKRMNNRGVIKKPLLLLGDTEKTLTKIPEQSI